MIEKVTDTVTLFILIAPIIIQLVRYVAVLTNQKKVMVLADRAAIIVSALDKYNDMPNSDKKFRALSKLQTFADELGIKLTGQQASDYIESAVVELRRVQGFASTPLNDTKKGFTKDD